MALREFNDAAGRRWEVWDTVPEAPGGDYSESPMGRLLSSAREPNERHTRDKFAAMPGRFTAGRERGWLTFASGTSRRRLSPIPDGWEVMSDDDLTRCLVRADAVSSAPARIGRPEDKA